MIGQGRACQSVFDVELRTSTCNSGSWMNGRLSEHQQDVEPRPRVRARRTYKMISHRLSGSPNTALLMHFLSIETNKIAWFVKA